jgi:hypothetical protein
MTRAKYPVCESESVWERVCACEGLARGAVERVANGLEIRRDGTFC